MCRVVSSHLIIGVSVFINRREVGYPFLQHHHLLFRVLLECLNRLAFQKVGELDGDDDGLALGVSVTMTIVGSG
jgi:hypothetical protein